MKLHFVGYLVGKHAIFCLDSSRNDRTTLRR